MNEIPTAWQLARLGSLTTKVGSGATPRGGEAAYKPTGVPLIQSMNVHFDGLRREGLAFIDDTQAKALDGVIVEANDVLLNITGASIGRVTTAPTDLAGARVNQHVAIIRPVPEVLPTFVARWLASPSVQRFIEDEESGATRQALTKEKILDFELPIPPLNEQRRIVEKLDAVFERSKAAKARLERLPALLEKLKRSVLAAAFRGDLTKDWRSANPHVEPASVLLARIRAERKRRWEEALRSKGKDPKKATYEEPPVDVAGLPELPETWAWASLEALSALVTDGDHNPPTRVEFGVPHLTAKNVKGWQLRFDDCSYVSETGFAQTSARYLPLAGDVIVTCVGTLGQTAVVPVGARFSADRNLAAVRPEGGMSSQFVMLSLNEPRTAAALFAGSGSSAQPHLYLSDLRKAAIAVAPPREQAALCEVIGGLLSAVAAIGERVQGTKRRHIRLEQAALAKAFRGDLVPQHPADEPAAVLLERIRAARVEQRPRRALSARAAEPELFATKPAPMVASPVGPASPDAVVQAFRGSTRLTATAIGTATGLDAAAVKKALKALVDAGKVRVEGKARGTSYVWVG